MVFARSPFLQGLLLSNPDHIPSYLSQAHSLIQNFSDIAGSYGLSQLEAALAFALSGNADKVVLGANSIEELEEVFASEAKMPSASHESLLQNLRTAFQQVETSIIDPRLWKRT